MNVERDSGLRDQRSKISAESASELMARSEEMDIHRLVSTVWRSRLLILAAALVGLGIAQLHLMRVTPLYEARARVLWEQDGSSYVTGGSLIGSGSSYFRLQSQIEIVKSRQLLRKVAERINAPASPIYNPKLREPEGWTRYLSLGGLIEGFKRFLLAPAIEAVSPSEANAQSAEAPAPGAGDDAADAAAAGGESATRAGAAETQGPMVFAGGASATSDPDDRDPEIELAVSILQSMIDAEWVGNSLVLEIEATTPDPQESAALANRVAEFFVVDKLEEKYQATRQATDWLSERVADLRIELEEAESAVKDFSASSELVSAEALEIEALRVKEMRERVRQMAEQRGEMLHEIRMLEAAIASGDMAEAAERLRNPTLTALVERIRAAESQGGAPEALTERLEAAIEGAIETRRETIARSDQQSAALKESIATLEDDIARKSESLVTLRNLERDAEASRLIYESFLTRLKESTVQLGIQQPDARMLSEARAPGGPSSPKKGATLALGFTAGLFLAIILVVLRERLNACFRTADDLEARTGIAVLGSLPVAPINRRSQLVSYLRKRPTSSFAESVRNLRTSILLANMDAPPQVIMVTSGLPGEGKTTTCIALAQISRSLGKRVVVLECDLRRRNFRSYFRIQGKAGILSVLSGAKPYDEVVYVDENTGMHVLPGEESSVNAADVFASQRFTDFVKELREHYDYVLIDTPPVLAVPDARVIGQHADAVVYLVRWNKTLRDTVAQGLRVFQQVNIRVTGLVLAQIDVREMIRYGYKTYGYYYKQTEKYYRP